jgi:hypothetical protein
MKGFLTLATLVILVGTLVGGVIGVLLPKITTGLSTGALCALLISTVMNDGDI